MSTVRITLPDGSQREMPRGSTARQVAESIGPGLARAALAARVGSDVWDLDRPIETDAAVAILTERDPEALELLRHSSAHILATAVRELFPTAGIGFGPPSKTGSTTTSRWIVLSHRKIWSGSNPRWPRWLRVISPSSGRSSIGTRLAADLPMTP